MHAVLDISPIGGESRTLNISHEVQFYIESSINRGVYLEMLTKTWSYWSGIKINITLGLSLCCHIFVGFNINEYVSANMVEVVKLTAANVVVHVTSNQ